MDYPRDNSTSLFGLIGALAVGAVAMYLLDPEQGRRRRALLRDQLNSLMVQARESAGAAARDLGNRTQGVSPEVRSAVSPMNEAFIETGGPNRTLH